MKQLTLFPEDQEAPVEPLALLRSGITSKLLDQETLTAIQRHKEAKI